MSPAAHGLSLPCPALKLRNMVHPGSPGSLVSWEAPQTPPGCTVRGQKVVHLSPPMSGVPKERPSVLGTILLKPGWYGQVSELSPYPSPSQPMQTSRLATCPSSWTPGRCLWRSSVNTCPMTRVSGSSPGNGCTSVRPAPSLLHPPSPAGQTLLQLLWGQAGWSPAIPPFSELVPESPTWPPPGLTCPSRHASPELL